MTEFKNSWLSWPVIQAPVPALLAGALFTTIAAFPAVAQTSPNPPLVQITVTPQFAQAGVARTIKIHGTWIGGCPPTGAALASTSAGRLGATMVIQLNVIDGVCFSAPFSPYSHDVTFTPAAAGVERILVVNPHQAILEEGKLITHAANATRSAHDLTGVWYDLATNGSGVTLQHSHTGSDLLAGGWFLFDAQGKARWYAIQPASWQSPPVTFGWQTPTLYIAKLMEFEAGPGGCGNGTVGCPAVSNQSREAGRLRIEVQDADHIVIEAIRGFSHPLDDALVFLFRSTLTRIKF